MRSLLTVSAALALIAAPAAAQRQPTPEQRIERLERQLRQLQSRVFPNGAPADTAGVADDPAASRTVVIALSNRIDNLERQLAEVTRIAEENGNRAATLQAEVARLRADQDRSEPTAEASSAPATTVPPTVPTQQPSPPAARPEPTTTPPTAAAPGSTPPASSFVADGEAAYDVGFRLWEQKKYDGAIAALRAMSSSFPGHRRVSWANNLVGRSLLDKGEPRAAAEALLANYRGNPRGERAPDSLFYLGKSLMALKQPGQACKAYSELEEVFGSSIRPALRELLPAAKSEAGCR